MLIIILINKLLNKKETVPVVFNLNIANKIKYLRMFQHLLKSKKGNAYNRQKEKKISYKKNETYLMKFIKQKGSFFLN